MQCTSLQSSCQSLHSAGSERLLGNNTKFAAASGGTFPHSDEVNAVSDVCDSACDEAEKSVKSFQVGRRVQLLRARRDVWYSVSRLLPRERVRWCRHRVVPGRAVVEVWHAPQYQSGVLAGVAACGMIHVCPYCAARVAAHRATELQAGIQAWIDQGGSVTMLTFTLRHTSAHTLAAVLQSLAGAHRWLLKHRRYRAWCDAVGAVGSVRALEITFGAAGWHPHYHVLLFHRARVRKLELEQYWLDALDAVGASGARGVALHTRSVDAAGAGAWYVSVAGCAREVALGSAKLGRGSLTFWQLALAAAGDAALRVRVYEYLAATRGYHVLQWSRGLRQAVGLAGEVSDDEVLHGSAHAGGVPLALIPADAWRVVVGNDAVSDVIELAAAGDVPALYALFASLGIPVSDGGCNDRAT